MNNSKEKKSTHFLGEGALLLMTIIWGGTFVIVKESLHDISSMLFVSIRFGVAALIISAYLFFKNYKINKQAFLSGIFLGLFLFFGFMFQTIGLKYTTATKSGFITGSLVVMVPFLQMLIEKKIPSKGALIGTLLVFIGILFLSSGGSSIKNFLSELGKTFNIGDTFTLICALFFALHVVYMDIISPKHDFWILFVSQLISVSVFAFLMSLIFHFSALELIKIKLTSNLWSGLLYTSLLATCVNFGLQTKFQKLVSPTKAGIIYSFEPIFAAIFAFFILNEKFTNFGLLGSVLIFSGLIVSEIFDFVYSNFFNNSNGKH
ncbi:MAG: DMT family transporter [Melioribacteraceae bacterium]